jgi:hypothetical protein
VKKKFFHAPSTAISEPVSTKWLSAPFLPISQTPPKTPYSRCFFKRVPVLGNSARLAPNVKLSGGLETVGNTGKTEQKDVIGSVREKKEGVKLIAE